MSASASASMPSVSAAGEADTQLTLFGTWRVGTAERQRAAVDAVAGAWRARPWPTSDLTSCDVLASTDGTLLLFRSRWAVEDPGAAVLPDVTWKDEVDRAVPGIERTGVVGCRLHRSRVADGEARAPGCVVLVTRVFDGPDTGRAERLVESLVDSTADAPAPVGLLSARFYVGLDGRYVFNYAEWTGADAHRAAITQEPHEAVDRAEWQHVHTWPGLTRTSFDRYHPAVRMVGADR